MEDNGEPAQPIVWLAEVARLGRNVCVLDVLMPKVDGREVLRRLRHGG